MVWVRYRHSASYKIYLAAFSDNPYGVLDSTPLFSTWTASPQAVDRAILPRCKY